MIDLCSRKDLKATCKGRRTGRKSGTRRPAGMRIPVCLRKTSALPTGGRGADGTARSPDMNPERPEQGKQKESRQGGSPGIRSDLDFLCDLQGPRIPACPKFVDKHPGRIPCQLRIPGTASSLNPLRPDALLAHSGIAVRRKRGLPEMIQRERETARSTLFRFVFHKFQPTLPSWRRSSMLPKRSEQRGCVSRSGRLPEGKEPEGSI